MGYPTSKGTPKDNNGYLQKLYIENQSYDKNDNVLHSLSGKM